MDDDELFSIRMDIALRKNTQNIRHITTIHKPRSLEKYVGIKNGKNLESCIKKLLSGIKNLLG